MRRKKKKIKKSNKEFLVIMYLFLAVFLSMMIYFVYFQVCKSESFINSPYNSLQDLFSDHVIRAVICPNCNVYPLSSVRGVIPANHIYKDADHIVAKKEK